MTVTTKKAADYKVDFEEEVRLAVVMYGGVSLAIYMYGVAEELWRLVRATCPDSVYSVESPPTALRSFEDDESTEPVYRSVALARHDRDNDTIRTRFVVDIVSGTSAGGINGVCLATALANESSLTGLEDIWRNVGALGTLVNDRESVFEDGKEIENLAYEAPPRSLLNGRRMLAELVRALRGMSRPAEDVPSSPLVDELDLWVTATDLEGLELPIRLANVTTTERRHANRYHFRFFRNSGGLAPDRNRNDFAKPTIDFLAYAARATSAFPFAFEPIRLGKLPPLAELSDDWAASFYPDYPAEEFGVRPFADGGILDNKPFTFATDALVRRRATLPVDRKLIYIEPDPEMPRTQADIAAAEPKAWNAIETTIAAVLALPRVESIRDDIRSVIARNREIERVRSIVEHAGVDREGPARVRARLAAASNVDWANMTLADILADDVAAWGTSYASYHRLKVAATIDDLARLIVRAARIPPDSDAAWAARQLVERWVTTNYAEEPGEGQPSDNAFLIAYDLAFRRRRLAFVYGKLRELQSESPSAALAAAGLPTELPGDADPRAVFSALRLALSEAQAPLYRLEDEIGAPSGPIAAGLAETSISSKSLKRLLEAPPDEHEDRLADLLDVGEHGFGKLATALEQAVATALDEMRTVVNAALGAHFSQESEPTTLDETLRRALRYYYDAFESYDLVLFPLQYATALGETNPVEIIRISPADATALAGEMPADKLALMGRGLGHFAAFLDESWRRHDMVLGRLHGAECLIRALAPAAIADDLVTAAHDRIFADYAKAKTGQAQANPRQWFKTHEVAQKPDPSPNETARRAAPVLVTVVQDILTGQKSGAAAAAGTAWETLSTLLPDRPGGWPAVRAAAKVLLRVKKLKRAAIAAVVLWVALVTSGVLLVVLASDWWRAAGGLLLVLCLAAAGGIYWLALSIANGVRDFVSSRVDALLDPYAPPPDGTGAAT